jgi:hypothetical protein
MLNFNENRSFTSRVCGCFSFYEFVFGLDLKWSSFLFSVRWAGLGSSGDFSRVGLLFYLCSELQGTRASSGELAFRSAQRFLLPLSFKALASSICFLVLCGGKKLICFCLSCWLVLSCTCASLIYSAESSASRCVHDCSPDQNRVRFSCPKLISFILILARFLRCVCCSYPSRVARFIIPLHAKNREPDYHLIFVLLFRDQSFVCCVVGLAT